MFEKILIISELHYNFDHVLSCVLQLKNLGTRSCLLVQCLNPHELSDAISNYIINIYNDHLEAQRQCLIEHGFSVSTRQMIGVYQENIGQTALEENCSLIVVGAPERTVIGSLLDGGAAYQMMQGSPVPLLLVRTPPTPDMTRAVAHECHMIDHVLFPTDFSENAEKAFDIVKETARSGVKKITLMHVQDKAKIDPHLLDQLEQFNKKDMDRLKALETSLKEVGEVDVDCVLLYGSPTVEILNFIKQQGVTWVIMGSQGRGRIRDIYLGNVSHNIARRSPVPVLLVPISRS